MFDYAAPMPRRKIIPDTEVFALVRTLLNEGGDKAVAFGPVARASGLAASTLVQRFQSRDAMVQAALNDGWDRLEEACAAAEANAPTNAKGASAFLKEVGAATADGSTLALLAADFRDPVLRDRAAAWRARVETALAVRLGGGEKGRETAALIFAAWMGQVFWQPAGGKAFKLKDLFRRLT